MLATGPPPEIVARTCAYTTRMWYIRCCAGQLGYRLAIAYLTHLGQRRVRMVSDELGDQGSTSEPIRSSDPSNLAGSQEQRGDVTQILSAIEQGDKQAPEQLLPLVYDELRKLAASRMTQEKPGQTLQATALVHEAYLRLVDVRQVQHWDSRRHFFSAAAEAMRRILVDRTRRKNSQQEGGEFQRVELSEVESESRVPQIDFIALSEALDRLEVCHPRKAEMVKLRFFAGLTKHQAAETIGVAPSTADLDWAYAKSWLRAEMEGVRRVEE